MVEIVRTTMWCGLDIVRTTMWCGLEIIRTTVTYLITAFSALLNCWNNSVIDALWDQYIELQQVSIDWHLKGLGLNSAPKYTYVSPRQLFVAQ